MPVYTYKGYDIASGATRKGKIEAESQKAARLKLRKTNKVFVSDIREEASLQKVKTKSKYFSSGVSTSDLAIMTRQFATLQMAHVPLDESLKALTAQVDNKVLRNALSATKDGVSEGKSLADSLAGFPGIFNRLYVNMVKAGESSGTLHIVLERLADFIEDQVAMRGKVISAITYPSVMILASSGIVVYLFVSVVPKLTKVFERLKVTLPWYTQLVLNVSALIQDYWYAFIIAGGLGYFAFKNWVSREKGRIKFDRFKLNMPLFGSVILRINVSQFTRTLSTLLNSGVPIIQSLEITKNIVTNVIITSVIDKAKTAVQEGQNLGFAVEKSGEFPPLVTHMIMTGEKTGQLEEMLKHVAVAYDAEVERKITAMISLIEPLMIIIMGAIIVVIVMALMMPMLSVMGQIR